MVLKMRKMDKNLWKNVEEWMKVVANLLNIWVKRIKNEENWLKFHEKTLKNE